MIDDIEKIIEMSWSKETCYPTSCESWSSENRSLGQCAITALIVNDFMGGKIMRCMVDDISHYYNLINGEVIDYTAQQFKFVIPNYSLGEERSREYLLSNEDTKKRYKLLLKNVRENFLSYGGKEYFLVSEDNLPIKSKIPGTLGGNKKLKIYGKLDCPSALRYISEGKYTSNRVFFEDEASAIKAGYRPCAVCMNKEYKEWKNKDEYNRVLKK